jgi:5-aminolevulinate synthase
MKKLNYKIFFRELINAFRSKGFFRSFTPLIRERKTFPFTRVEYGKEVANTAPKDQLKIWCTNDYLNMSHNQQVIDEMVSVIQRVGTGSGGTRNISGTTPFHQNLESTLSNFHDKDAALVFNSAYLANQTTIWTICKALKDICVFSDSLNHASLIQGIKNSNSECKVFDHNDLNHLEELLKETDKDRPKLIVFESLYSMDGTIVPVSQYTKLAKKYNALTYLDEVHAVGLYGRQGRGVADLQGVAQDVDIINGTLAKSFGQIGGYIVADKEIIDYVKSYAPGFIFTTSIMPSVAAAAAKSINIVKNADEDRALIMKHARYLRSKLSANKIPFINSDSHIVPVMAFDSDLAKTYSKVLNEDFNIYIQPIFYPTVPKGEARLRITITPKHSIDDIDALVRALSQVIKKNDSEQSAVGVLPEFSGSYL